MYFTFYAGGYSGLFAVSFSLSYGKLLMTYGHMQEDYLVEGSVFRRLV